MNLVMSVAVSSSLSFALPALSCLERRDFIQKTNAFPSVMLVLRLHRIGPDSDTRGRSSPQNKLLLPVKLPRQFKKPFQQIRDSLISRNQEIRDSLISRNLEVDLISRNLEVDLLLPLRVSQGPPPIF